MCGTDGAVVDMDAILRAFTNAPTLAGKPKLFIVQTCKASGKAASGSPPSPTAKSPDASKGSSKLSPTGRSSSKARGLDDADVNDPSELLFTRRPDVVVATVSAMSVMSWATPEHPAPTNEKIPRSDADSDGAPPLPLVSGLGGSVYLQQLAAVLRDAAGFGLGLSSGEPLPPRPAASPWRRRCLVQVLREVQATITAARYAAVAGRGGHNGPTVVDGVAGRLWLDGRQPTLSDVAEGMAKLRDAAMTGVQAPVTVASARASPPGRCSACVGRGCRVGRGWWACVHSGGILHFWLVRWSGWLSRPYVGCVGRVERADSAR